MFKKRLVCIHVRGESWQRFKQVMDEIEVAKLVSYDPQGGCMAAWVACLDAETADRLTDGWDG